MVEFREGLVRRVPRPILAEPPSISYGPDEIGNIYGFPAGLDGSRTVIAVLEYGSGWAQPDLDAFCDRWGLPHFTPKVVSVDKGQNDGGQSAVDMEATLDLEWLHAKAPGADLVVFYSPPETTMAGFGQTVCDSLAAVHAYPRHFDAVSISYGAAEGEIPRDLVERANDLIKLLRAGGTEVFVASGDWGDYGTPVPGLAPVARADWPASCPDAIAVGGTKVPSIDPLHELVWDESGFGATGGGFSAVFPRPDYHAGVHDHPMRGLPDVAALADPFTGYQVVFQGRLQVVGGTSVACPVHAALYACIAAEARRLGRKLADYHQVVYAHPQAFRDIVGGTNAFMGTRGYVCGPGWDPCTGLGAPKGEMLLEAFLPAPAAVAVRPRVEVGVDSLDVVTPDLLHRVQSFLGLRPAFWGRYLAEGKLTQQEVGLLFSWGIGVLPIWNGQVEGTVSTEADGITAAESAIAVAQAIGIPAGVTLVLDVERGWPLTSICLNAWADTLARGGYGAGVYLSPEDPGHVAALAGMDPSLRSRISIDAAKWAVEGQWTARHREWIFWERISTPPWPTDTLAGTSLWQFAGNQLDGTIDLQLCDLTADPAPKLWQP